jgi:hypothetical protein
LAGVLDKFQQRFSAESLEETNVEREFNKVKRKSFYGQKNTTGI